MINLYFLDKNNNWVVHNPETEIVYFPRAQEAALVAEKIPANDFAIVSSKNGRTLFGKRFGSEILWRMSNSHKPFQRPKW